MSDGRLHRLAVFAAFAALAAVAWGSLLADPPIVRLALAAVLVTGVAAALSALPLERLGRVRSIVVAAAIALVGVLLSLVVLGAPASILLPWEWSKVSAEVNAGLDGLSGTFDYPFAGEIEASRWLLVAGMPALLILGTVLAFGRRASRDRPDPWALLVLIAAVAVPVTARPATMPLLWGAALLALSSVWLWRRPRRWAAAIATVVCFGALSVPISSALEREDPVFDTSDLTLPTPDPGTAFEWDSTYGPIDWERTDDVLFEVRTDTPRYLRAEILDDFYGYGWRRSEVGGRGVPEDVDSAEGNVGARDRNRWVHSAEIAVGDLESSLVVAPGTGLELSGIEDVERDEDGTLNASDPLTSGSDYSISAYAPNPSARLMRNESKSYPSELRPYTEIAFPYNRPDPATGLITVHRVPIPLWDGGTRTNALAESETATSPYAEMAALSQRLTADAGSAYEAVRAVEDFVRNRADYSESAPDHDVPLKAFLFGDRVGYCQHFAGAMALMLRFAGIPTRVAAGFTPGERQGEGGRGEEGTYEVTGFDAHSWVEVYFNGVGWVPFDPTPAAAPNRSQAEGESAPSSANPNARIGQEDREAARAREPDLSGSGEASMASGDRESSGGPPWKLLLLIPMVPLGVFAVLTLIRALRHRRLGEVEIVERELRELADALGPAGLREPGLTTLHRLRSHFERLRLPAAAAYAGRLADLRFAPSPGAPPTLAERRAARRDLSSGGGPSRYLRMLMAMPPGGPRA